MYAIIRTGGGEYYTSLVFACLRDATKDSYHEQYYLTLNGAKDSLVRSYAFEQNTVYLNQLVLITETENTGWLLDGEGWGCVDFLAKYESSRIECDITHEDLMRCQKMDSTHTYLEWRTIEGERDITDLMEVTGGFHDAYIKDWQTTQDEVFVRFGGTWGCDLEMWFKLGAECYVENFDPNEGSSSWFGAVFFTRGGFYYLINSDDFDTTSDLNSIDESYCWFKGRSVTYHVIPL